MISDAQWLEQTWERLSAKFFAEAERLDGWIPYIAENGRYVDNKAESDIAWWTNGFWAGAMWQMYHATNEPLFRRTAERNEQLLDRALEEFDGLHHDVGFMWQLSAVANYRLTNQPRSRARGLHAATILAGRYNPDGRFLRAWNEIPDYDATNWLIIDALMNLSLLYWAAQETGDARFSTIAKNHADTVLRTTLRPDGSSKHIVEVDPLTGAFSQPYGGQGYSVDSAWSRGQSWAIYGMALSTKHTGESRYQEAAIRAAEFFVSEAEKTGYIPLADFRAPAEPVIYDTIAGAVAACGLLELFEQTGDASYRETAVRMLRAIDEVWCDYRIETDGIVGGCTAAYWCDAHDRHTSMVYCDYFFLEAVLRLRQAAFPIW